MGTLRRWTLRFAIVSTGAQMGTSSSAVVPTLKRQRRSPELKRKIVEETLAPGASVARVARAHGVNANQVFQWRRLYHAGRLGAPPLNISRLLPVSVSNEPTTAPAVPLSADLTASLPSSGESGAAPGVIHLELRKARLRIEGNAEPAVLRLVLKALLG